MPGSRCSRRGAGGRSGVGTRLRRLGVGAYRGGLAEGVREGGVPPGESSLSSRTVAFVVRVVSQTRLLGKGLEGLDGAHRRPLCRWARVHRHLVPDAAGRSTRPRSARPMSAVCAAAECRARGCGEAVARTQSGFGRAVRRRLSLLRASCVSSVRASLRQGHPGRDRQRAGADRSVRRLHGAAVEHRRASRPLLPGVRESPVPAHRPLRRAGGSDPARGARGRRAVHPAPRRVRAGQYVRGRLAAGRSRLAAGGRVRSGGSGWSRTPPPGSSTRGSPGT